MSKIRQSAHNQPCQIRLVGVCNSNRETTVLAHYRLADTCGMGIKPPDFLGAYACSDCHDVVDGRRHIEIGDSEIQAAFAEGVMRTLILLHKQNLIDVK